MAQALPKPHRDALLHTLAKANALWVECAVGDLGSVARGKRVHADDFASMGGCKLPSVVLGLSTTAGESDAVFGPLLPTSYDDVELVPDLHTLVPRPGRDQEATVICEPSGLLHTSGGTFDVADLSPRAALRRVLQDYSIKGLRVMAAPELEFFLLQRQDGESTVLQAARCHPDSPVQERSCEAYSLERLSHFEPFFDALYEHAEALGIPLNGHAHESALGQYEVNFRPGDALDQADAVFRFKRLARELAQRHGFIASFAAKPYLDQPGVGMHWHMSLLQHLGGQWQPVFASGQGDDQDPLLHFIAGIQREADAAMAVFAPYDMSYDRIRLSDASPTHASWGWDGRGVAFRVPASTPANRRLENRLPGGDANPYLSMAVSLGLGLRGLSERGMPCDQSLAPRLPQSLPEALDAIARSEAIRAILGERLVALFVALKRHEHQQRQALARPREDWDLRYLLELA